MLTHTQIDVCESSWYQYRSTVSGWLSCASASFVHGAWQASPSIKPPLTTNAIYASARCLKYVQGTAGCFSMLSAHDPSTRADVWCRPCSLSAAT